MQYYFFTGHSELDYMYIYHNQNWSSLILTEFMSIEK